MVYHAAGVDHLTVCDDTFISAKYCAILETHMLPSALTLFRRGQNWMFRQDNAPCHTSRARRTWLQEHSIQVLGPDLMYEQSFQARPWTPWA